VRAFAALIVLSSFVARADKDVPAGFRAEGEPKIETVFGDVREYRRYVDRFYAMHGDMQRSRLEFQKSVQGVLLALGAERGRGKCPVDTVAAGYARATRTGQTFHRLGKELEASIGSIRELDGLGETAGLTPDYRWKVARALKLYPETLKDFREMKASFQTELLAEVKFRGCDPAALVAKGEEMERAAPAAKPAEARPAVAAAPAPSGPRPAAASTATFFVDNTSCPGSLRVYVDESLIGEVATAGKGAFQTLAGRHELCLIPADRREACGSPGTVRQTYIHDGWSIALRCD
jgi:hypothetical protein